MHTTWLIVSAPKYEKEFLFWEEKKDLGFGSKQLVYTKGSL